MSLYFNYQSECAAHSDEGSVLNSSVPSPCSPPLDSDSDCVSLSSTESCLSVLCEMTELFLKTYLVCTPLSSSLFASTDVEVGNVEDYDISTTAPNSFSSKSDLDTGVKRNVEDIGDRLQKKRKRVKFAGGSSAEIIPEQKSVFEFISVIKLSGPKAFPAGVSSAVESNEEEKTPNTDENNVDLMYFFRCSPRFFQYHLLAFIHRFISTNGLGINSFACKKESNHGIVGTREEMLWLADVLWNVGTLFMKKDVCKIPSVNQSPLIDMDSAVEKIIHRDFPVVPEPFVAPFVKEYCNETEEAEKVEEDLSRCKACAEILELSEQCYHVASEWQLRSKTSRFEHCEKEDSFLQNSVEIIQCNQCRALLSAIAVRLDIYCQYNYTHKLETSAFSGNENSCFGINDDEGESHAQNAEQLLKGLNAVKALLSSLFEQGLTKDHPIHKLYTMLSLSARLIISSIHWNLPADNLEPDHSDAECFLSANSKSFLALTPLDLLKCVDVALGPHALGGGVVVARRLLHLAVQLLMRESLPSYVLLGNVYRRLVELSPDKDDVSYFKCMTLLLMD